ncbi:uncharacterized protein LOC118203506 [Stegodyphus dumicola]|uniref:uncharacterized protein LOC118203506 n=1 Tax=Stegodyphus dumicola TaxID=202533 RepID=UPI0015AE9432|nr:uncharacterized protein LOC118203506 [Stegodyphus dumicola]
MFCRMNIFLALISVASLYLSATAYTHNRAPSEHQETVIPRSPIVYKIELEKEGTRQCQKNWVCAEIIYDRYDTLPMKRLEQRRCHCSEGTECWYVSDIKDCPNYWCQVRREYLYRKGESSLQFACLEVTCESIQSQKNNTQKETTFNITALYQNKTKHINNEINYIANETDHTNNETIQPNNDLTNMTSLSRNKTSCFSEEETELENITAQYENETVQPEDEPTPLTVRHLEWRIKIFIQKMKKSIVEMKRLIWKRRERTCQLENETPQLNSQTTQLGKETATSVANEMLDLANRTKELVSRMRDFSAVVTKRIEIKRKKTYLIFNNENTRNIYKR